MLSLFQVMAIWVVNTTVMETGKGAAVQAEAEAEVEAVEGVVAIVAVGEVMVCLKPSKMQVGTKFFAHKNAFIRP
jgi:hypothetical protein